MKRFQLSAFVLFGLLCLTSSRISHAQWAIYHDPQHWNTQTDGSGIWTVIFGDAEVVSNLYASVTVDYPYQLQWTGGGTPSGTVTLHTSARLDGQDAGNGFCASSVSSPTINVSKSVGAGGSYDTGVLKGDWKGITSPGTFTFHVIVDASPYGGIGDAHVHTDCTL